MTSVAAESLARVQVSENHLKTAPLLTFTLFSGHELAPAPPVVQANPEPCVAREHDRSRQYPPREACAAVAKYLDFSVFVHPVAETAAIDPTERGEFPYRDQNPENNGRRLAALRRFGSLDYRNSRPPRNENSRTICPPAP